MKQAKMLGLLTIGAALMSFPAISSATTVTAPAGTVYTGVIKAENEGPLTLHGPVDITCNRARAEGKVEKHGAKDAGGKTLRASGKISLLVWEECNHDVVVQAAGSLSVETAGGSTGPGTLRGEGARVTVLYTDAFFGLDIHCVYGTTGDTHLGVVTPAANNESHAVLDLNSAEIPVLEGSELCGEAATWTGKYKVVTPKGLRID